MPVKIHLTEEARDGFALAQPQEYYGLNCWQGCGAYVQRYCAPRDEPAEIVLFTVPSTLTYLFNHRLTQIKINISALQIQYGIRAFAKFKRPECTRLHLRYVPGGACTRNVLEKCAVRSPTEAEEGQSKNILQIQKNILNRNVFLKSLSKSLTNLKNYCKS